MIRLLLLLLACASICRGAETNHYATGAAAARKDVAAGTLRLMSHGMMPRVNDLSLGIRELQILRETYGVDARSQGCMVAEGWEEFDKGYNSVVLPLLTERFGVDVLKAAASQARRERIEKTRPGAPARK